MSYWISAILSLTSSLQKVAELSSLLLQPKADAVQWQEHTPGPYLELAITTPQ
jgi:hypothetical protein